MHEATETFGGRPLRPAAPPAPLTHPVLGIDVYVGDLEGAVELVLERARSGAGGYACLCGAHGITVAQRLPEQRAALRGAWLNFPDGAPVAWRQLAGGELRARRTAGPDLMPLVIAAGRRHGLRHYLFGSTARVLDLLAVRLRQRFPGAQIVGAHSPPFRPPTEAEEAQMLEAIRRSQADVVWVGLGTPKQDIWMHEHARALGPVLAVGVGAAFDFLAGTKPRAPLWMQRAGLEWLHRIGSEPRRLAPRYLQSNSRFLAYNARELLERRNGR